MARHRSLSRSYSPRRRGSRSPPPRDRNRHEDDDYRRRDRRDSGPTGLLVRNIPLNARPEDLRIPFERYGPVKDVYLPKDFNTGKPRGFGFVKYRHGDDAAEAKHQLNNSLLGGREIRIVYAEENRKTPQEMRSVFRPSNSGRYGGSHRRRSPPRSPRRQYHSSSRSPSPVRDRRHRDDDRSPVQSRSISRSPPREKRRPVSRSPRQMSQSKSPSPRANGRTRVEEMDRSPSISRSPRGEVQISSRFRS